VGTRIVRRPQRQPAPEYPVGEILLEPPPELPRATGGSLARMAIMLPMLVGGAGMALMLVSGRTHGPGGGTLTLIAGGMFGTSMVGMMAVQVFTRSGTESKSVMMETRRRYLRDLGAKRAELRATIIRQREALHFSCPPPASLWSTAESSRRWERRPADDDFGIVRIGVGDQPVATPLVLLPPSAAPEDLEPTCAQALRRFERTYRSVPDLPIPVSLRHFTRLHVDGARDAVLGLVRALLCQLVTFHAPDDAVVAFCVSDARRGDWEWAKWLPHALHPTKTDALGQLRLMTSSVPALEAMLGSLVARSRFVAGAAPVAGSHVVVVLDGGDTLGSDYLMTEGGLAGVTLVDVTGPVPRMLDDATLVLRVEPGGVLRSRTFHNPDAALGRPDCLGPNQTEALARQLAPLRLSAGAAAPAADGRGADRGPVDLIPLLGLGGPAGPDDSAAPDDPAAADPARFDPARGWAARTNLDRLRLRFGVGADGAPVELDLKESAHGGMGPHGLLVGATGSGKSELLRTLVLGLAMTHSPEVLNFVLIDFKGGAAFGPLAGLPHTGGLITNLSGNLALVDRVKDALSGELQRRQEQLAPFKGDLRQYEQNRREGAELPPLPSLLIICDEFSELLVEKPEFIAVFDRIARVGRSAGVHLLLSSQRIDGARLQTLDTQISYRLCLRTFNAAESRVVLGSDVAHQLDRHTPGLGYLKVGADQLVWFKSAYVSGTHRDARAARRAGRRELASVRPYTTRYCDPATAEPVGAAGPEPKRPADDGAARGASVLDIVVGRMSGRGAAARKVWPPPLDAPATLDLLLAPADPAAPPLLVDAARGLVSADRRLLGALTAVVGVTDRPSVQRQDPLVLRLDGPAGNVLVLGGPRSGKSLLLRTMIVSLALCHAPAEAQFYCLDFGGGSLTALRGLPHVGGVAIRSEAEAVRRTVAELGGLLRRREQRFAAHGVDGMAEYRGRVAAGTLAGDGHGEVFCVVDGWMTLRTEFEALMPEVTELVTRGLGYGIHVVGSCGRSLDAQALADSFGTKLELRLGDPSQSAHRREALNVPADRPGRGLTPAGLHFLAALPRIDGRRTVDGLAAAVDSLVTAVAANHRGPDAPPVRLLPRRLTYAEIPPAPPAATAGASGTAGSAGASGPAALPIGVVEADLGAAVVDFARQPCLVVLGEDECGKSELLRCVAHAVGERYDPGEAIVIVVDHGRSPALADAKDWAPRGWKPVLRHCRFDDVTADVVGEAAGALRKRLGDRDSGEPAPGGARRPELFLLVDDYDLVATGAGNPLTPVVGLLAQAREIGLRLVVARRVGGAMSALYADQLLKTVVNLGSPGILMSGPRDEGKLFGRYPGPLPPGRGWLVSRRGEALVQFALAPPAAAGAGTAAGTADGAESADVGASANNAAHMADTATA
jgi:S-DNA-T family DNA segregation ATPase FtsK/SpoIIIE